MPFMKGLDYIRVVLMKPSHPGNIGACARAMANMGASRLTLVQPADFPSEAAFARAAGAGHILQNANVTGDLDQALADCELVIGASARSRSLAWPSLPPAQAMRVAIEGARNAPVALLFGRESRGLSNSELERCHYLVSIPTDPAFPSLNLAAAALLLLYELRQAADAANVGEAHAIDDEPRAPAKDMRAFYLHLQQLLQQIDFGQDPGAGKLHHKLVRLFNRAQPYAREIRMLRGIFRAVEEKIGG
ncbi:MAG: RNA methyltransferase [Gammaproteobacteria bacterium]